MSCFKLAFITVGLIMFSTMATNGYVAIGSAITGGIIGVYMMLQQGRDW